MPAGLDGSQIALAFAMGISTYIGALHLWFWRQGRGESTHGWVALWCATTLVFQGARLVQTNTLEPATSVLAGRAQTAMIFVLAYAMVGFATSLGGRRTRHRLARPAALAAVALGAVALFTDTFISGRTDLRLDWWGHEFIGAPATPAASGLIALVFAAAVFTGRASRRAPIEPAERRALSAGMAAYLGCAVLSLLSALRLVSTPMSIEYAPLPFALALSYLLGHRHRRLTTELEEMVEGRTGELGESERRYRRLIDDAPIGVLACDPSGRITAVNAYLVKLLGSPSPDATLRFNLLTEPRLVEAGISAAFARCFERNEPVSREFAYTSEWNRRLLLRAHIAPLRDDCGEITGAQAVVEDISERSELERSLRQSRKMEAVGQLAAGIAHEINNPMAYVRSNLTMVRDECAALDTQLGKRRDTDHERERLAEIEELVDDSLDGVERTVNLVREVKEFSHGRGVERETVLLNDVIEDALRFASPQKAAGVTIERHYGELPGIEATPSQLRQLFLNLVVNALQALGERGTVRIITRRSATGVIARIEDDGDGIEPAVRDRIFEPFFTTKQAGEGTGLGLYFAYQIAKLHEGKLVVESVPGIGTAFEVQLPLRD